MNISEIRSADEQTLQVLKALASGVRLRILDLLNNRPHNVSEIAQALEIPLSTATLHIGILEEANLIESNLKPAERGLQKLCVRRYDRFIIDLSQSAEEPESRIETSIPLGTFVQCQVSPPCGLAGTDNLIGYVDDPASFYDPDRIQTQLLWLHRGYVEYRLPNRTPPGTTIERILISMEIGSEAPPHRPESPSDITLWINGVEIGTWTSRADHNGQRGRLTPAWWPTQNPQYGMLKVWQVLEEGSYVDGMRISATSIADLKIAQNDSLSLRIGIKEDAQNAGGINIFGGKFGLHPQDILVQLYYQ